MKITSSKHHEEPQKGNLGPCKPAFGPLLPHKSPKMYPAGWTAYQAVQNMQGVWHVQGTLCRVHHASCAHTHTMYVTNRQQPRQRAAHTHVRAIYVTNGRQLRRRQRSRKPVCTSSHQAQSEQKHNHCLAALGAFLQYRIHGHEGQDEPAFSTTASSAEAEACRIMPGSHYGQSPLTRQPHYQLFCTTQGVDSHCVSSYLQAQGRASRTE